MDSQMDCKLPWSLANDSRGMCDQPDQEKTPTLKLNVMCLAKTVDYDQNLTLITRPRFVNSTKNMWGCSRNFSAPTKERG